MLHYSSSSLSVVLGLHKVVFPKKHAVLTFQFFFSLCMIVSFPVIYIIGQIDR